MMRFLLPAAERLLLASTMAVATIAVPPQARAQTDDRRCAGSALAISQIGDWRGLEEFRRRWTANVPGCDPRSPIRILAQDVSTLCDVDKPIIAEGRGVMICFLRPAAPEPVAKKKKKKKKR